MKTIYTIPAPDSLGAMIEVYGEPENAWYEWRIWCINFLGNKIMDKQENPINTILDLASEEVKGWPEWMRSNDHRREMERIERETLGIACPACGSTNVQQEQATGELAIPYGPVATFIETVFTCGDCGTSGDFTGDNEATVRDVIATSQAKEVKIILEWLNEKNISETYLERALRLPARTVARWKAGKLSAVDMALLRLVRTYPWMLDAADGNFSLITKEPEIKPIKGTIITDPEICKEIVNEVKTKPVDAERKIREAREFLDKLMEPSA